MSKTKWLPAISNHDTGTINIKANKADNCTSNENDTTSGLCVYAEGDKNYISNTSDSAVSNVGNGTINIDGGTYFGGYYSIGNHFAGFVNIKNANVLSGNVNIVNYRNGTINICNSILSSDIYDIYVDNSDSLTGIVNYSSSVVFTDGTNNPSIKANRGIINANYTGTCTN